MLKILHTASHDTAHDSFTSYTDIQLWLIGIRHRSLPFCCIIVILLKMQLIPFEHLCPMKLPGSSIFNPVADNSCKYPDTAYK